MKRNLEIEPEVILWKDRRRYLGMPLSFTRYELTAQRLTIRTGLFTTKTEEILLFRILDINLKRSFGQKLFGVGSIACYTMDRSSPQFELKNIKHSEKVRRLLGKVVEAERDRKRISAREVYGAGFGGDAGDIDLDGDGIPDILQ